jgi:hypothetical protein
MDRGREKASGRAVQGTAWWRRQAWSAATTTPYFFFSGGQIWSSRHGWDHLRGHRMGKRQNKMLQQQFQVGPVHSKNRQRWIHRGYRWICAGFIQKIFDSGYSKKSSISETLLDSCRK